MSPHRDQNQNHSHHRYRFLVIGQDAFALAAFGHLVTAYGEEEVGLMALDPITGQDLRKRALEDFTFKKPNQLRGEANIAYMKGQYPESFKSVDPRQSLRSFFYKGKNFHPFDDEQPRPSPSPSPSRLRSQKLLPGEEFFTNCSIEVEAHVINPLFTSQKEGLFQAAVERRFLDQTPIKIEFCDSSPSSDSSPPFRLFASRGDTIECEHLIWAHLPYGIVKLLSDKMDFDTHFIEFCETTRHPQTLYVKFEFQTPINVSVHHPQGTIFLPLNYTHEWGHFIGELQFQTWAQGGHGHGQGNSVQHMEFVTFIDDKDQQHSGLGPSGEEAVFKKIRILKRHLKRIYPAFEASIENEVISLNESLPVYPITDDIFYKARNRNHLKNITFVGPRAPLKKEQTALSHFARGLAGLHSMMSKLSGSSSVK